MSLSIIRGEEDVPIDPLLGRTIAVIGYGNQGHAHALNLGESGLDVIIGARPDSRGSHRASNDGFQSLAIPDAVSQADLIIMALPDEVQGEVYANSIGPHVSPGATIGFLHGFAVRFGLITPSDDVGVVMVAPKGPGRTVRERFTEGRGLPCLLAVHHDPRGEAEPVALAWARGIGCARAGIIRTTFADETETDLFGEQTVLCGGLMELIVAAFETLVDAGYAPELAYLECCHEVKQIGDLIYEAGPAAMREAISNTAEFGAYRAGRTLIDDRVRRTMRDILQEIRNGGFAEAMTDDAASGFQWFLEQRHAAADHPLEPAGQVVRSLMPWLGKQRQRAKDKPHTT